MHERARLAESLIASLDQDTDIDRQWRTEVGRRIATLDARDFSVYRIQGRTRFELEGLG